MDDLEFRRRAYADPGDKSPEFVSAATTNAGNRQFMEELKEFNRKLEQALDEPVPPTLPDKLKLSHLLHQPDHRKGLGWRHLVVATSIAFALGFSTRFMQLSAESGNPPPSVAQVAMRHVQMEMPFTRYVDEELTLATVNAKLRPYGAKLKHIAAMGKIYYANHCMFAGGPAAHLVIQGEFERLHVFLVPMERALQIVSEFSEANLHGEVLPMTYNRLVVIGDKQENVHSMAEKVRASLERAL